MRGRPALAPGVLQPDADLAQRGQAGVLLRLGRGPYRGHGQRGGPPALAPAEQQPRPAGPGGMTLGQHGQLGAVRGGPGAQLGRAQREPVLVQDLQPAAAGGQHSAWIGRRLGAQRFAEPAAGPGQRRAVPPAPRGRAEMVLGVGPAAQVQRHPPGQQVSLGDLGRAERRQLLRRSAGPPAAALPTAGPARYRARPSTSPVCACHQALCWDRNRRWAASARSSAVCGWAAASAQLAAISSSSDFQVDRPRICSRSASPASASASASLASPAASSTAHRSRLSADVGTFSGRYRSAAVSR